MSIVHCMQPDAGPAQSPCRSTIALPAGGT